MCNCTQDKKCMMCLLYPKFEDAFETNSFDEK